MYILQKAPIHPIPLKYEYHEPCKTLASYIQGQCPTIEFGIKQSRNQISSYVKKLIEFFFDISEQIITEQAHLVDDIERFYWAKELDVAVKDVTYGKLFCSPNACGELTGGISDRGLAMYLFLSFDLPDAVGIEGSELYNSKAIFINNLNIAPTTLAELIDTYTVINHALVDDIS